MDRGKPLIVGIGGTTGGGSSTEHALLIALTAAENAGARTIYFGGDRLSALPHYNPKSSPRMPEEIALVDAVRQASGMIVASPGYHGNVSGLVKNALDLLEDTAQDNGRAYLTDMPIGLIATAYGWQATGSTIAALRSIVHAFRGWPTPYAAAVNSRITKFDGAGGANDADVLNQLQVVGEQVARFAVRSMAWTATERLGQSGNLSAA